MRASFIIAGIVIIACTHNLQAMNSLSEKFESPLAALRMPDKNEAWTHNITKMREIISKQIKELLGTDLEGKPVLLRSKTKDEVLSYAHQISKLLDEVRFNPTLYLWAVSEALDDALSPEDFDGCEEDPNTPLMENYDLLISEIADAADSVGALSPQKQKDPQAE